MEDVTNVRSNVSNVTNVTNSQDGGPSPGGGSPTVPDHRGGGCSSEVIDLRESSPPDGRLLLAERERRTRGTRGTGRTRRTSRGTRGTTGAPPGGAGEPLHRRHMPMDPLKFHIPRKSKETRGEEPSLW